MCERQGPTMVEASSAHATPMVAASCAIAEDRKAVRRPGCPPGPPPPKLNNPINQPSACNQAAPPKKRSSDQKSLLLKLRQNFSKIFTSWTTHFVHVGKFLFQPFSYRWATRQESSAELPNSPVDPLLESHETIRFDTSDPKMLDHLRDHGYAVVREVMTATDVARAEDLLWDFLGEHGLSRRRPSTWTDEAYGSIGKLFMGIVNGRGVGQSDLCWFVRTQPLVRSVFERIWDTSQLIVSFDAISVFRPWHHKRYQMCKTHGSWFHVDQGRSKEGLQCVQGFVSLTDQDTTTGGLVVVPGSHKKHAQLIDGVDHNMDFIDVPTHSELLQAPHRLVRCRAGDLVLWDSRCVHCNTPALEQPTSSQDKLLRTCVYVCMTPKAWATEAVLKDRRAGYEIRVTTSHWPHTNVMGFGWNNRGKLEKLSLEKADAARRDLIG